MKITLIGYGKMGKAVEEIALQRGHSIAARIDLNNMQDFTKEVLEKSDVAIEFSTPKTAYQNIQKSLSFGIPIVSGTTGWYDKLTEIQDFCKEQNGTLLVASNFSLGMNILFALNKKLAQIMSNFPDYSPSIDETHHTQKLDAPSGTAITLAQDLISQNSLITGWKLREGEEEFSNEVLPITAHRIPDVPGIHTIEYASECDTLQIQHTAHSRKGLALGAVLAAEFIHDKKGIFSMNDVLKLS